MKNMNLVDRTLGYDELDRDREMVLRGYNPDNEEEREAYDFRSRDSLDEGAEFYSNLESEILGSVLTERDKVYSDFLDEVENSGVSLDRLSAQPNTKARILMAYFPKFRADGKQDLNGERPAHIGALFRNFVYYSRDRLSR